MRYLMVPVLAAFAFGSLADTEVPYTFSDGTPAKAAEVNANFDAVVKVLNSQDKDVQPVLIDCNNDESALSQALDGRTGSGPPLSFNVRGVCLLTKQLLIARSVTLKGDDANAAIKISGQTRQLIVGGSGGGLNVSNLKMVDFDIYLVVGPGNAQFTNVAYEGTSAVLYALRGGNLSSSGASLSGPPSLTFLVSGGSVGYVGSPTGQVDFEATNNSTIICSDCGSEGSEVGSISLYLNSTFCESSYNAFVNSSVTLTANSSMSVPNRSDSATQSVDDTSTLIIRDGTNVVCG